MEGCTGKIFINTTILFGMRFINRINTTTRAIIKATAGAGKSLLMKKILLDTLQRKKFVPIFIELRKVNRFQSKSLKNLIYAELKAIDSKIAFDHIEATLEQ